MHPAINNVHVKSSSLTYHTWITAHRIFQSWISTSCLEI